MVSRDIRRHPRRRGLENRPPVSPAPAIRRRKLLDVSPRPINPVNRAALHNGRRITHQAVRLRRPAPNERGSDRPSAAVTITFSNCFIRLIRLFPKASRISRRRRGAWTLRVGVNSPPSWVNAWSIRAMRLIFSKSARSLESLSISALTCLRAAGSAASSSFFLTSRPCSLAQAFSRSKFGTTNAPTVPGVVA